MNLGEFSFVAAVAFVIFSGKSGFSHLMRALAVVMVPLREIESNFILSTESHAANERYEKFLESRVGLAMRVVVTLSVLAVALYAIVAPGYSSEQQKWASGAVGTILGYWLKG